MGIQLMLGDLEKVQGTVCYLLLLALIKISTLSWLSRSMQSHMSTRVNPIEIADSAPKEQSSERSHDCRYEPSMTMSVLIPVPKCLYTDNLNL